MAEGVKGAGSGGRETDEGMGEERRSCSVYVLENVFLEWNEVSNSRLWC